MTNRQFRTWREKHFRSRRACGMALGLDRDAVEALETGKTRNGASYPVRPLIALSCAAWTLGLRDYDGGAVTIG